MKDRKIGLEYEFLAIQLENGYAATRSIMKSIWRKWSEQDNVEIYIDHGTKEPVGVVYKQKDGQEVIVNTDAGINIVEFGFLPFFTLEECYENMIEILGDFLPVAESQGVGLLAYGIQPKTPYHFPDLKSEKIWYRGFLRFPGLTKYHNLFHNIAANQPCIDISYDEMMPVLNTFNAMSGVFIALFANSGWGEFREQDCHEEREHRWNIWHQNSEEKARFCGMIDKPFADFTDYLKFNWNIPLRAVHRGETLHGIWPAPAIVDYLKGEKWTTKDLATGEPSEVKPEISDVNLLNMYPWIQARPKFFFNEKQKLSDLLSQFDNGNVDEFTKNNLTKLYLETRNIACQPWENIMSAPAFLLGLIENIEPAKEIVDNKSWEYWIELREKTIKKSLAVDEVVPLVEKLLEISKQGLEKRGLGEEKYLQPLFERLEKRESPAIKSIKDFEKMGMDKFIESRLIKL